MASAFPPSVRSALVSRAADRQRIPSSSGATRATGRSSSAVSQCNPTMERPIGPHHHCRRLECVTSTTRPLLGTAHINRADARRAWRSDSIARLRLITRGRVQMNRAGRSWTAFSENQGLESRACAAWRHFRAQIRRKITQVSELYLMKKASERCPRWRPCNVPYASS